MSSEPESIVGAVRRSESDLARAVADLTGSLNAVVRALTPLATGAIKADSIPLTREAYDVADRVALTKLRAMHVVSSIERFHSACDQLAASLSSWVVLEGPIVQSPKEENNV